MADLPPPYPKEGYCGEDTCLRMVPDLVDHFKHCHSGRNLSCPFNCGVSVTHFRNLARHVNHLHGRQIGHCNYAGLGPVEPPGLISGEALIEKLMEWGQPNLEDMHVRTGFVFKYNSVRRMPDFVFFCVTKKTVEGSDRDRPLFVPDQLLHAPQLTHHVYDVSGMHHGHTVPFASFKGFPVVQDEASRYSVLAPMLFEYNDGPASALEGHARNLVTEHGHEAVYVMMGPITTEENKSKTAGGIYLYTPTFFWTILVIVTRNRDLKLQVFKLPHDKRKENIFHQTATIEELEECTKMNIILPALTRDYTWNDGISKRCYVCKINLPEESYYEHRADHIKNNYCLNTGCLICFDTPELLEDHWKLCRKDWDCNLCGSAFRSKFLLNNHLIRHESLRPFSCNLCPNRYAQLKNLQRHERSDHGPPAKLYCGKCKKNLPTQFHFDAHMQSHRGVRDYFCLVRNCRNTSGFKAEAAVQDHLRQVHKILAANQNGLYEKRSSRSTSATTNPHASKSLKRRYVDDSD